MRLLNKCVTCKSTMRLVIAIRQLKTITHLDRTTNI